jgi:hypothetical protein
MHCLCLEAWRMPWIILISCIDLTSIWVNGRNYQLLMRPCLLIRIKPAFTKIGW